MTIRLHILAMALAAWLSAGDWRTARADDEKPEAAAKSLDDQLLDDLDGALFNDLDLPDFNSPGPKNESGASDSGLDEQLRNQFQAGEDIGEEGTTDPLSDIAQRMRLVEKLIGDRVTSASTQQMQSEIVVDLAKLIEQLQKQSSGTGSQASSSQQSGSTTSQASSEGARDSQRPANTSVPRLGKADAESAELAALQEMLDEVWGHLPARVRQQMQNASVEQFLPKYETLIEEYYKRLAEETR